MRELCYYNIQEKETDNFLDIGIICKKHKNTDNKNIRKTRVITLTDGWRIVNILRKEIALPQAYKHFDTRENVALEMKTAGAYDTMYPFVTLVGKCIAHGCDTGSHDGFANLSETLFPETSPTQSSDTTCATSPMLTVNALRDIIFL